MDESSSIMNGHPLPCASVSSMCNSAFLWLGTIPSCQNPSTLKSMLSMQNVWSEVLRCVSRWELLQQLHSGGPTDALLFSPPPAESPASNPLMKLRDRLLMRTPTTTRPFGGESAGSTLPVRPLTAACHVTAVLLKQHFGQMHLASKQSILVIHRSGTKIRICTICASRTLTP